MPDEEKLFEEVVSMRVKGETKGLKERKTCWLPSRVCMNPTR